jgi:hypothetical protein
VPYAQLPAARTTPSTVDHNRRIIAALSDCTPGDRFQVRVILTYRVTDVKVPTIVLAVCDVMRDSVSDSEFCSAGAHQYFVNIRFSLERRLVFEELDRDFCPVAALRKHDNCLTP